MATLSPTSQAKVKHDMQKSNERVAELQSIHRDQTVTEIASKFKGKSVVESRVQFQQKQSQITQKDRLLQRAIFYFQSNKRQSRRGLKLPTSDQLNPAAGYNTNLDEEMKLPEAISKLQSFWTANPTTPTKGVSHRANDIRLDLSPKRERTRTRAPIDRVTTKDFEEELEESGISRNTLSAEDWEHWQKAIASAVEDHRNGEIPILSPMNSSSIDDENHIRSQKRNNGSFSEIDEKDHSFDHERSISPFPAISSNDADLPIEQSIATAPGTENITDTNLISITNSTNEATTSVLTSTEISQSTIQKRPEETSNTEAENLTHTPTKPKPRPSFHIETELESDDDDDDQNDSPSNINHLPEDSGNSIQQYESKSSEQKLTPTRWQRIESERDSDDEYEGEYITTPIKVDPVSSVLTPPQKSQTSLLSETAVSSTAPPTSTVETNSTVQSTKEEKSDPISQTTPDSDRKEQDEEKAKNPVTIVPSETTSLRPEERKEQVKVASPTSKSEAAQVTEKNDSSKQGFDYLFYGVMLLVLLRILFELWCMYTGESNEEAADSTTTTTPKDL